MSRKIVVISILVLLTIQVGASFSVPRAKYLEFARKSADWVWANYDSLVQAWKEKMDPNSLWGYRPPAQLLDMATIDAEFFKLTGEAKYAERAKKVLLSYGDFRKFYPRWAAKKRPEYANGVPALPDFFTAMRYIRPYDILKKKGLLSKKEQQKIEDLIAHSIDFLFQTQEWGAMNRAILRGETLAWAIRAIGDHPKMKYWKMYEKALGFDNWGNWEIEDASLYHGIWLYSLIGYADAKNQLSELFETPEMYYYSQYYLNLICPDMMIPDFGDALWRSNWHRYLVFFEAAANQLRSPELKWAASQIVDKFMNFDNIKSSGLAYMMLDCYRFATDDIQPKQPTTLSREVMEDIVGKKIVFRNGWDEKSTYLLLNYRDEGDGGLIFRDYLRDGIPVEEEKMTHGHADENSIVLLMHNGSVLLHDGGYRDYMPSGPFGAYRQDYFHNRLCVRQEKIFFGQKKGEYRFSPETHPEIPGQSVLDFLHNAGSYRRVRTQKIDFLTFEDFDYSRTRVIDDKMGYQWDRTIVYVKNPEMFVVFDVFKAIEEDWFTAANLWHTRKIVAQGEHWYDTKYDSLRNVALDSNENLCIYFPKTHYRFEQVEKEKRYYQDEWVISQYTGQYFELGQHIGFVTVLIPHGDDVSPAELVKKIEFVDSGDSGKGMSVKIHDDGRTIHLGIKCDLRMDMVRDYRRPKFTYESGKIRFAEFESNGDFFYLEKEKDNLSYTVVNVSKIKYGKRILFSQKPALYGLAFDGAPDKPGVGKVRYWRDSVEIRR
ncbi:MAG: hypothetical protein GXO74_06025 [Calditrichaeota bacterium]|nr:hypothetical protein [Calditrichota bacterium]